MKTAEEYIKEHPYVDSFLSSAQGYEVLVRFMIDFSKLHVKAALEAVHDNIEVEGYDFEIQFDSILNAYPLENIK